MTAGRVAMLGEVLLLVLPSESFVAARTPLWAMAFAGAAVALMSFLVGLLPKPEEYSCRAFLYSDIAGMRLGVILLVPLAHLIAAKWLAQRGNTRKQEPHHSRA